MKLRDKKRSDILHAAILVFQESGYAAARVDDIARCANVSKRTLYNHFASKQVLFDAIVGQLMEDVSAIPVPPFEPERRVRDQLITALTTYVEIISAPEYIAVFRLLATEFMRDKTLAQDILTRPEFYVSPVLPILKGAMAAHGRSPTDAERLSDHLLALVKHHYFWPQFMLGSSQSRDMSALKSCVDDLLGALAPE